MNAPLATAALVALAPGADRAARQAEVVAALAAVLPAHALLWHKEDTVPYECDGLTAYRQMPMAVAGRRGSTLSETSQITPSMPMLPASARDKS